MSCQSSRITPSSLDESAECANRDKTIFDMGYRPSQEYIEETYSVEVEAVADQKQGPAKPGLPVGIEMAEADETTPLGEQTRTTAGPLIDDWINTVKAEFDDALSLQGLTDWIDGKAIDAIDTTTFTELLQRALVAANLKGRYDVETGETTAFAEGDSARVLFDEQIKFFRNKLNIKTHTWTDIWQSQHDVAFVVAGAARDDLLTDLRGAVDSAIHDGTTIKQFREQFDRIVEKHGWSYNGGRDWRTRVIYNTNLKTSYAAGRWQQLQATKESRPYWRYRHSDVSENARELHLAWDGLVLDADDPWWHTNYPPNGWGCNCYVEAISSRELERSGKKKPDKAPALQAREVTVGKGAASRTSAVPAGVDPGFAYAPGREASLGNAVRQRLLKSVRQPPSIAANGVAETLANSGARSALTDDWKTWRRRSTGRGTQAEAMAIGVLQPSVIDALKQRGIITETATVTASRRELAHLSRIDKRLRGQALEDVDLDRFPEVLAKPEAVILDTKDNNLLYVFTPINDKRKGKLVVRVNYSQKLKVGSAKRKIQTTNTIRTAGYVDVKNLKENKYQVIDGGIK